MLLSSLFLYEQNAVQADLFSEWDIPNPVPLAKRLWEGGDVLSGFITKELDAGYVKILQGCLVGAANVNEHDLRMLMVTSLNRFVTGFSESKAGVLWRESPMDREETLTGIGGQCLALSGKTSVDSLNTEERRRLNRQFLEKVYPEGFQVASPFTCGVGMAADANWDSAAAFKDFRKLKPQEGSAKGGKRRGPPEDGPSGLADHHPLLRATRLWSTGLLIHPQVVVTAAHAPHSPLVMGDRVMFPGVANDGRFPQRIVRVSRIFDHPQARKDPSCDVRLMLLHYEDGATGVSSDLSEMVHDELKGRCRPIMEWSDDDPVVLYGLLNVNAVGQTQTYSQKLAVANVIPDGPEARVRHQHDAKRERILEPAWPVGTPQKASEFGDSGAPVAARRRGEEYVVGLYIRRSINRAINQKPSLVAVRLSEIMKEWGIRLLQRYNIDLEIQTVSGSQEPITSA